MLEISSKANSIFPSILALAIFTACPTNVGTGIRVSVMLHLPALKLTGEIEKFSAPPRT